MCLGDVTASFVVAGFHSPDIAGTTRDFTVTAKSANGTTATGYTGTVDFSSSDTLAVLPADYTFTAADAGDQPRRLTRPPTQDASIMTRIPHRSRPLPGARFSPAGIVTPIMNMGGRLPKVAPRRR